MSGKIARGSPHARVYVLRDGDACKIGSSWEPHIRLRRGVRRGVLCYETPWLPNGRVVERTAHKTLRDSGKCMENEWFLVDPQSAVEAVVKAMAMSDANVLSAGHPKANLGVVVPASVKQRLDAYVNEDSHNRSRAGIVATALDEFLRLRGR